MKKYLLILLLILATHILQASNYQWSVKIKDYVSPETKSNPEAFLWIPSNCKQVRAVVFGQHNMCEETIFDHPEFRRAMTDLGFAIIWVTPGFEQQWNVANGCQIYFDAMMNELAEVSGYSELKYVPIAPLGHSAMATFPWNFAAWNAEKTLAIISFHGDAPRTNLTGYGRENIEWGRTRNIDGIPGLMIEGEYEWWEARVNPALAFRMMYPESCISFLCDAGRGHFDVSDNVVSYISLFLKKAAQYRLPENQPIDAPAKLKKVDIKEGWLAERWHPNQLKRAKANTFSEYKGNNHDAFWYFDKEMTEATENYYKQSRNKKNQYIGFAHNGQLYPYDANAHVKYNIPFAPLADGLTFEISALFSDSLRQKTTKEHASYGHVKIDRICGPVNKINDSTFMVSFYRMGFDNFRRTNSITLLASHDGDDKYKSAVQELEIRIPYPQTNGLRQSILFPSIQNVDKDTKSTTLHAQSDQGLPIYYYVKEGPAEIDNNVLKIDAIPPRAKYPIKVTVVAWQYGVAGKIQTAEPVQRSFYIEK